MVMFYASNSCLYLETILQYLYAFFAEYFKKSQDNVTKNSVKNLTTFSRRLADVLIMATSWSGTLSWSNGILLINTAILFFIGFMFMKQSMKLKQIQEQVKNVAIRSDEFAKILHMIRNNITWYKQETRCFEKKFETTEEKVVQSVSAAVSVLDLKSDSNFESIHEVLGDIQKSVAILHLDNKTATDNVLLFIETLKNETPRKGLGKINFANKSTATDSHHFHADYLRRSGRPVIYQRDTDAFERSITITLKKSLNEYHTREFPILLSHKLRDELQPVVDTIKSEIYNSSYALKEVIQDGQSINAILCKNLVVYLTEISEQTVLKILTTTDQIKYCLNYLHENQVSCTQDILRKLALILNEKFPKESSKEKYRRKKIPDYESGDDGLLIDEDIELVPNI